MAVYEILGEIIEERGLSIADVAKICDLSDSTVRGIMRRKQETIALEVAFKISAGLGVSLEKLNGMPERIPSHNTKNSPSTAEAAPGEADLKLMEYLKRGVYDMGFLPEGADLTDRQVEALLGVCAILHAIFDE